MSALRMFKVYLAYVTVLFGGGVYGGASVCAQEYSMAVGLIHEAQTFHRTGMHFRTSLPWFALQHQVALELGTQYIPRSDGEGLPAKSMGDVSLGFMSHGLCLVPGQVCSRLGVQLGYVSYEKDGSSEKASTAFLSVLPGMGFTVGRIEFFTELNLQNFFGVNYAPVVRVGGRTLDPVHLVPRMGLSFLF